MDNDAEHTQAVAEYIEVVYPMDPRVLQAGDLGDNQPCGRDADAHQNFCLEAITPQVAVAVRRWRCGLEAESRCDLSPEGVESVAQVCVPGAIAHVGQIAECTVN
jgi:hypothetical protein